MKKNLLGLAAAVALFSVGCASVRPELKERTDRQIASFQAKGRKISPSSERTVRDWAPGQYVLMRTVVKNEPALLKMTILSKDSDGIWVENESLSYRGRGKSRLLFRAQPRNAEDAKEAIRKVVTIQEDGKESTIDFEDPNNPMAKLMKGSLQSTWSNLVISTSAGGANQTITVPAGTFEGCIPYSSTVQLGGYRDTYDGSIHFGVPINGSVQSRSKSGESASELLDFGFEGGGPVL